MFCISSPLYSTDTASLREPWLPSSLASLFYRHESFGRQTVVIYGVAFASLQGIM